jgi:glutathione S-transferase
MMILRSQAGKLPFGQVPVLEVAEGTFIGQSAAIVRYLGKRSGLYPEDPIAAAVVDSIMDEETDLLIGPAVYVYGGEGVYSNNILHAPLLCDAFCQSASDSEL